MTKEHQEIVAKWEAASGFELMRKEEIRGKKTLSEVLRYNQKWLEDHHTEVIRRASSVISHAWLDM